jgi:hypothetical protein
MHVLGVCPLNRPARGGRHEWLPRRTVGEDPPRTLVAQPTAGRDNKDDSRYLDECARSIECPQPTACFAQGSSTVAGACGHGRSSFRPRSTVEGTIQGKLTNDLGLVVTFAQGREPDNGSMVCWPVDAAMVQATFNFSVRHQNATAVWYQQNSLEAMQAMLPTTWPYGASCRQAWPRVLFLGFLGLLT